MISLRFAVVRNSGLTSSITRLRATIAAPTSPSCWNNAPRQRPRIGCNVVALALIIPPNKSRMDNCLFLNSQFFILNSVVAHRRADDRLLGRLLARELADYPP